MSKIRLAPKILNFRETDYVDFTRSLSMLAGHAPNLAALRDIDLAGEARIIAREMFHDAIDVIKKELSTSGIVVADIPECPTHTSEDNAFWGVVMASTLG